MPAVDYSPLSTPLSRDQVRQYRLEARRRGTSSSAGPLVVAVFAFAIGGMVAIGFALSLVGTIFDIARGEAVGGSLVRIVIPLIFLAVAGVAVVIAVRAVLGRGQRHARMQRFAATNGMTFTPALPNPGGPGMIFDLGSSRMATEVFDLGADWLDRPVRVGSYRYTTGSGKSRQTHDWGFLSLRLDRQLPHMVLDAAGNDVSLFGRRISNLPVGLDPDQRLSLEGDFDRHFTLYAPKEYERDALYVFTPDLMALLIDAVGGNGPAGRGASYDVEIVDDTLYLYSSRPLDLSQQAVWDRLLRIVMTVGSKTLRQTTRYADERVGDRAADVVAPGGRRLKRRFPVIALVFVAVAVLWTFADEILGLFH